MRGDNDSAERHKQPFSKRGLVESRRHLYREYKVGNSAKSRCSAVFRPGAGATHFSAAAQSEKKEEFRNFVLYIPLAFLMPSVSPC